MPRGLFNWTFNDIVRFLKNRGFTLSHVEGSHHFYVGEYSSQKRLVCIQFHGQRAIKPRTLKGIIRQSGIPVKEWRDW